MCKVFKGFTICLISLFLFSFNLKTEAANAYFVWEKSEIEVPVFSNINDYKQQYVLKFYVNGVESNEYEVTMEVNTSTFSTVLTNKVGRYTVYYKAYSKKYYVSSTQAIVFNVVDKTPPSVTLNSTIIKIECGNKITDLSFLTISDDTCKNKDLKVFLDDSEVLYDFAGIYKARLIVKDLYDNQIEVDFFVEVIDVIKPQIKIIKNPIFNYGEQVDFKEYFMCVDDVCGDITELMKIEGFKENKLGKQQIKLSISDYSGNYNEIFVDIFIVDNEAPTLVLLETELTLDILDFSEYDANYFKKYVFMISDNYTKKSELILDIDIKKLEKDIADYPVVFTLIDENNNKTEMEILVKLRELVGPTLIVDDVIYLEVGDFVDLLSFATATDVFDPYVNERILIELGDFNPNKPGQYIVTYKCFNTSGLFSEKEVKIIVGDAECVTLENTRENDFKFETIITISIIVIIFSGAITFIFVRRSLKRKRNNTRV